MNKREVCLLIGKNDVVLWSDASDSPVALPDSRARWDAIWSRRSRVVEIAHSHPVGPLAFSREDETTMHALVSALGRSMRFSVVAPNGLVRCVMKKIRFSKDGIEQAPKTIVEVCSATSEPWWAPLLRLASGMSTSPAIERPAKTL